MKSNLKRITALLLTANMAFSWAGSPALAEEAQTEADMSMVGSMAFAQCDEYVNVRSGAGTDTEVVGKIYNNHAAMIMDREGDWYKIKSGNVIGYVSTDYFATGEEAQQIAEDVAYCVATVHPEALMVRATPNEESDVVDMAVQNQELEVVQWDGGEWMTVAMGNDVYGYVNAYYVDYNKYYAVAETLEEEAARLGQEQAATEAAAAEVTTPEIEYAEDTYYEDAYVDDSYYEDTYYEDTYVAETEYVDDTYYEDTYVEETEYAEDTYYEDAYVEETEYVEDTNYDDTYYEDTYVEETEYVEDTYYEDTYVEETEYVDDTYYEDTYVEETESSTSGLGAEIASFALQFVGNPYVYGGTSLTNGADCSGFVQSVFASYGIYLPRTAADQAYSGTSVDLGSIQAGDLLFYSDGSGISHVALYIGGGQIVHASTSTTGIIVSDAYYSTPVCAARYWS